MVGQMVINCHQYNTCSSTLFLMIREKSTIHSWNTPDNDSNCSYIVMTNTPIAKVEYIMGGFWSSHGQYASVLSLGAYIVSMRMSLLKCQCKCLRRAPQFWKGHQDIGRGIKEAFLLVFVLPWRGGRGSCLISLFVNSALLEGDANVVNMQVACGMWHVNVTKTK